MGNFIEFQNVTFRYEVEGEETPETLRDFSISFQKGDFVAVLGHNGCGKSTLAKLCNAIELPQRGRILVNGPPMKKTS